MNFKVGQKVRVREDLEVGQKYELQTFAKPMDNLKGIVVTIQKVFEDWYTIQEDSWFWTDEMLEPVKNCDNCGNRAENFNCKAVNCYMPNLDKWKPIEEKQAVDDKDFIIDYRDGHKEYVATVNSTNKTKMKIILISGKAFSGKDSAANMMKAKLESQNKKVLIAHYGDLVKYTCKTFFDWNGEKDEQGRTILQEVGTDRIRAKRPDIWVDYIKNILSVFEDKWDYVLIPDTRFPNEIDVMKNTFKDVISIRVVRTNFISLLTEEQRNHRSEIALDDYPFDYYFVADDLKTLERKVDNFLAIEGEK